MKRCTKCGEEKPRSEFSANKNSADGLRVHCKACSKIDMRMREEHPELFTRHFGPRNITEKACKMCLVVKPRSEFYPKHTAADGLRQVCKACARIGKKELDRAYWLRHRDERIAAMAADRKANPEKYRRHNRAYYVAHKDEISVSVRSYRLAHVDMMRAARRRWAEGHPEQVRANAAVMRERRRRRAALGTLTASQWMAQLDAFDGRCAYCGACAAEMDHVLPVSRGGEHDVGNVVPACYECNRRKGAQTPGEWRRFVKLEYTVLEVAQNAE